MSVSMEPFAIRMHVKPSLPTFNGGDKLHNRKKRKSLPHTNLNFKTKNSLTRKNSPEKNPFKCEIQPNSASLLIIQSCVTKHSPIKENDYCNFPDGPVVKNPPANAGDTGSIPGPGGSHRPWSG